VVYQTTNPVINSALPVPVTVALLSVVQLDVSMTSSMSTSNFNHSSGLSSHVVQLGRHIFCTCFLHNSCVYWLLGVTIFTTPIEQVSWTSYCKMDDIIQSILRFGEEGCMVEAFGRTSQDLRCVARPKFRSNTQSRCYTGSGCSE